MVSESVALHASVPDSNYFAAAQALWSLSFVPGAEKLSRRIGSFLARGREHSGAWRFWTPKTFRPVDADTDMTACAAAALRSVGVPVPATTAEVLLASRDAGGRFLTWVRPPAAPNDVCAVVNANVLWYLGERPETEPAIRWLLDLSGESGTTIPLGYYDTPVFFHHAVSRAAFDGTPSLRPAKDRTLGYLSTLRRPDGAYGNPLETALTICTRVNFGERDSAAVQWLLGQQETDGSWPAAAFWNGPEQPAPRSLWWGSAELTTAVALEALCRSEARGEGPRPVGAPPLRRRR